MKKIIGWSSIRPYSYSTTFTSSLSICQREESLFGQEHIRHPHANSRTPRGSFKEPYSASALLVLLMAIASILQSKRLSSPVQPDQYSVTARSGHCRNLIQTPKRNEVFLFSYLNVWPSLCFYSDSLGIKKKLPYSAGYVRPFRRQYLDTPRNGGACHRPILIQPSWVCTRTPKGQGKMPYSATCVFDLYYMLLGLPQFRGNNSLDPQGAITLRNP